MTSNSYETRRLNLPFFGICTFGRYPHHRDWSATGADAAVLGASSDCDTRLESRPIRKPAG